MKSQKLGKSTLNAEVLDVRKDGIWVYVSGREYFMSYEVFPWFRKAAVSAIYNVELLHGGHLHWPDLDVDIELDSLEHPEAYPLRYK